MEIEEEKKEVSEIIRKVIHAEEIYYLDGKYVRWGRVEKDLHAVIERLLTKRAADGAPQLWRIMLHRANVFLFSWWWSRKSPRR